MLIELQSHSTVSDGQLPPAGVVEKAAEAGVTTLALTDHDAIAGVPEAAEAAERLRGEAVAGARVCGGAEVVENFRRGGFDRTLDDAIREAGAADSIGRPHIAKAAGATGDLGPFFEEYLVPGAKAFVPRRWPTA